LWLNPFWGIHAFQPLKPLFFKKLLIRNYEYVISMRQAFILIKYQYVKKIAANF